MWKSNEKLPIIIGLEIMHGSYSVKYEIKFTGIGGSFNILKEIIEIDNICKIERI